MPGFEGVLGHELVGVVEAFGPRLPHEPCERAGPGPGSAAAAAPIGADGQPLALGMRVCAEINCNDAKFSCADAIFQRNHAPGR